MRTTYYGTLAAAALTIVSGCTVKDVDLPALAGPSTFAHSIVMTADRDTLTQNGADFTDIRITSVSPTGQSENIALRAQVFVDGVAQDFGTLSTKTPTTPTTIRYTAPAASTLAAGQVAQTVSIRVTPSSFGDFRSEVAREIDLRLVPQGIILPSNPNLVAAFTFTPSTPQAFQTVSFDAATSTNGGVACAVACTYSWSFGDGTSASGITTTHAFRTVSVFPVTLTVTDARGASTASSQSVNVSTPTPPTATFTMSPTPAPTNVDVFFNATASRAQGPGRTLVNYSWNFGDGSTGSGVTVSHKYVGVGSYTITLSVTDDAQATAQASQTLIVGAAASQATAALTVTPAAPKPGQRVALDASASTPSTGAVIVTYQFDYGDGSPLEQSNNPVQSHTYPAGSYVVAVMITDSNGKTSTKTAAFTVA
jgi:hypothetical protein